MSTRAARTSVAITTALEKRGRALWVPHDTRDQIVDHYNDVRLNSATGYITPKDMLAGRRQEIHADRDRKLEEARKMRKDRRQQAA